MFDWESDLRIIEPYYANPGQNSHKYMRLTGQQPGGIHRNLVDFKGQCQEKVIKSMEI